MKIFFFIVMNFFFYFGIVLTILHYNNYKIKLISACLILNICKLWHLMPVFLLFNCGTPVLLNTTWLKSK